MHFALIPLVLAIVGGGIDPGDPAVVVITAEALPVCTGTLIAPNTVLTAGHCVKPLGDTVTYYAGFGPDTGHLQKRVKLARQLMHPSYAGEGKPYDIGLLELATPVDDIAPVALRQTTLSDDDVGVELRHVGFGIDDETAHTGWGTRRDVRYPLNRIDDELIWSGAPGKQTCDGDSGGPALIGDELVAVVSDGPNCHEDGVDARVDTQLTWIRETMQTFAPEAAPSTEAPSTGCSSVAGAPEFGFVLLVFFVMLGWRNVSVRRW